MSESVCRTQARDLVPLPLDADDEFIHVGDDVRNAWACTRGKVVEIKMVMDTEGDEAEITYYDKGRKKYYTENPKSLHHCNESTVREMLREFLSEAEEAMRKGYDEVPDDVYAQYAAMLQLRGDL